MATMDNLSEAERIDLARKAMLALVDSLNPDPQKRAYALRAMDAKQAAAWRATVDRATRWHEQLALVRIALEDLGPSAWVKLREHARAHGLTMPDQLSEFLTALIPETSPPSAPHKHPLRAMLSRDLARGVARAWMELTGEFPPIVRAGGQGPFFDLMAHAFEAAGLKGAENHAYEAAVRVRGEKDEHRRMGNPEFIEWRDEVRRAMGELQEYRRPRRGRRKSVQRLR